MSRQGILEFGEVKAKAFVDEAGLGEARQGTAGSSLATDDLKRSQDISLRDRNGRMHPYGRQGIQMNGEVRNVPEPLDESGEERGVEQKAGGQ